MMECFWTSVAIMAAFLCSPAHCQQDCLPENEEGVQLMQVPLNEGTCTVRSSTILSVSYMGPDIAVVSWSPDLISTSQSVTLTLYAYEQEIGTKAEVIVEDVVMGTSYILEDLFTDTIYVVELTDTVMPPDGRRSCAVLCPLTEDIVETSTAMVPTYTDSLFPIQSVSFVHQGGFSPTHVLEDSSSAILDDTDLFPSIPVSIPPTRIIMQPFPSSTPSIPATAGTEALSSATIIGAALGGFVALVAFMVVTLIICWCFQRKKKSISQGISNKPKITAGAEMYETPVNIIPGSNAIENPSAYTTPIRVHYVKQANAVETNEGNLVIASQPQDYEQNFTSACGTGEPQMYETALSINSHKPSGDEARMYEEPIDSVLQYQHSQGAHEEAQQPYEVPVHTNSHEDQGILQPRQQGMKPDTSSLSSATMSRQDERPPTYASLNPGTLVEPHAYTAVNRTPSPSFYSTPFVHTEPAISIKETTPPDSHHYFALDRDQAALQQPTESDLLYFERDNGCQHTKPAYQEAVENEYIQFERKDTNGNERTYFELEHSGSNPAEERPQEALPLQPEEHPYFVFESK